MIEFIDSSTLLENKSLPAQQGVSCGAKILAEEQQNPVPAAAQKKCLEKTYKIIIVLVWYVVSIPVEQAAAPSDCACVVPIILNVATHLPST